jgi:hypothetical protein
MGQPVPSIRIQPYTEDWTAAVKDFNSRVLTTGLDDDLRFPESHIPWYPKHDGAPIFQEFYLAVEDTAMRGGFCLTFEPWKLDDGEILVSHYRLPISEGIRDKAYKHVSGELMRGALERQPHLYCLGMGGFDRPVTKSLKKMGWSLAAVPFLFKVNHPQRFLHESPVLRKTPSRKLLVDFAAYTGTGWLAIKTLQTVRSATRLGRGAGEIVPEFGPWADELWQQAGSYYRFLARRDSASLNLRYAPAQDRFIRLKVGASGWALLLDTPMRNNKYFGNLRVGSIVDVMARPEHASEVAVAATRELERRGVDLLVTNQANEAWVNAFRRCGFLEGPSNYVYAVSPPLAQRLGDVESARGTFHLTRGDGPGPTRL